MTWLFNLLSGGLLNSIMAYLNKREDVNVVENNNATTISNSAIAAESARMGYARDIINVAMSHPIWWFAWGLGVFPVLTYYAAIFFVSTFPFWGWKVAKVPVEAQEFARLVVGSMFTIGGASTLVAGIAHAWKHRT